MVFGGMEQLETTFCKIEIRTIVAQKREAIVDSISGVTRDTL